jgi:hypothetical protein
MSEPSLLESAIVEFVELEDVSYFLFTWIELYTAFFSTHLIFSLDSISLLIILVTRSLLSYPLPSLGVSWNIP